VSGGRLRFDYDDEYRRDREATPLSLSMPIPVQTHGHQVIDPWLWNLLPDNENVLGRWGREHHVSARSPFSLLATPIGEDCAGAVRFVPANSVDDALGRTGSVTWLTEEDVGERLGQLREDSTAWHGRTFTGQFSLAGAQAKTALLNEDGRWGVPSGSLATTHILKPAVMGFDEHDPERAPLLDCR
jgi:serine/threonine-protein kinase HipA